MHKEKFSVDLYIRVSTDRQAKEGDSLEEQEKELKKFCEYRQFQIRHIYIERGKSGGNTKRPEYQKLIKDIATGKINAVVVKKLDRLSRSLLDFEEFMILSQEHDVEFISLKENFDTTSAMGKAMLRVALVFAQLEREQGSERISDVMIFRAGQGLFNGGRVSFGFTNVNKELVPYPKERQIVELIFEKFLETKSTVQVADFLNETGYRTRLNKLWDPRRIQDILLNPVYIGKVRWRDEEFQGIHQPIISEKQFQKVQDIFKSKTTTGRDRTPRGLLQKLLVCGLCNCNITPTYGRNRTKQRYDYYLCSQPQFPKRPRCKLKYLALHKTDQMIIMHLISLAEQKHFLMLENKVLKHNKEIDGTAGKIKAIIQELEAQLQLLKQKKDHYLDSLIAGQFSSAERKKINERIDEMELEIKQAKGRLYKQEFEHTQVLDEQIDLTKLKQIFVSFKADYEILSRDQIREFLVSNIEKIIIYEDSLKIILKNIPFSLEFNWNKNY